MSTPARGGTGSRPLRGWTMGDQIALFWRPAVEPGQKARDALARVELPAWMNGTETTEQRRHARAGRHPTGRELGSLGRRCGECGHRVGMGSTPSKCALDRAGWETNISGTNVRTRWRACNEWRPK